MDHPGRGKRLHLKFCVDNGTAIAHHKVVARANELRAGLHFVYGKRATKKIEGETIPGCVCQIHFRFQTE